MTTSPDPITASLRRFRSGRIDGDLLTADLWARCRLAGDLGDEAVAWPDGCGMARYGLHVLRWSVHTDGEVAVWTRQFRSAIAAETWFSREISDTVPHHHDA